VAELITMPKLGFDMVEGKLQEWVAKAGAAVKEGEVIAIVETDKASVEVPAFRGGVLHTILVAAGVSVPIGKPIAVIANPGEAVDLAALGVARAEAKVKAEAEAKVEAKVEAEAEGERVLASPVALRMAAELGLDLHKVAGTGPAGRIIKRDIETYVQERAAVSAKPVAAASGTAGRAIAAPPPIPTPSFEPTMEGYQAVPLTPMRQAISRRMIESKQTVPHFYVTMDVDMAAAMALRSQLNALVPEAEKISVNDFIVKAAAIALRQFPNVNASFAGSEIHVHDQVNIGMAVAR